MVKSKMMLHTNTTPNFYSLNQLNAIEENFKMQIIDNYLNYLNNEYLTIKTETEQYFCQSLDNSRQSFKEEISKKFYLKNYISAYDFNNLFKAYAEASLNESYKLLQHFSVSIFSYLLTELESKIQNLFSDFYFICLDQKESQQLINTTIIDLYNSVMDYSSTFFDEYITFSKRLIRENFYILLFDIKDFFKTKEFTLNLDKLTDLQYIDKYKNLNKLALKNGYVHIRDNGGHAIFINKKTKKTVVIPQGRAIGKGLSFRIQLDILDNKTSIDALDSLIIKLNHLNKDTNIMNNCKKVFNTNNNSLHLISKKKRHKIIKNFERSISSYKFDTALRILLNFINRYSNSTAVINIIASVYASNGDVEKALQYYKEKYI